MGEDNKEEAKKEEAKEDKKEGEKKEEQKGEEPSEIVLKVDMHCEACARKAARALKGFDGVEEVRADSKASKVVVKGKAADPIKVWERLQKKSGKKVELISPLPKPPEEKKEENKEPQPEEKKEEPPPVETVVLKVRMHCEACAQVIQKLIPKIQGVESVETDLANDQVVVKGVIDPTKLVDYVYKRTGKQASIVKGDEKKGDEKKEEEKKEEEKTRQGEENKGDDDDNKTDIKRSEYWPSKDFVDYVYPNPPHIFCDQIFSDENPNACSAM